MREVSIATGQPFNAEVDRYKARFREMKEEFKEAAMSSGYPPGQVPVEPREQYMRLLRAELAGESWFGADPEAQKALATLKRRYSGIPVA